VWILWWIALVWYINLMLVNSWLHTVWSCVNVYGWSLICHIFRICFLPSLFNFPFHFKTLEFCESWRALIPSFQHDSPCLWNFLLNIMLLYLNLLYVIKSIFLRFHFITNPKCSALGLSKPICCTCYIDCD